MLCLGIETSCDETAAAVVADGLQVYSNVVSSQYVHSGFGGVVPELAARQHMRMLVPVVEKALSESGSRLADIDLVAVTHAPGLLGALLVGLPFAKALACALNKPFVGVNHLEGHLFAVRLGYPELQPPFLAAVLSGGHTELLMVEDWCRYCHLGSTVDDAGGEAFDKVAKLLGLPYPGGALLEQLALEGRPVIEFPVADPGGLDFSYSGLKTAVMYYLRQHPDAGRADVAASFQAAAVGQVLNRIQRALREMPVRAVAVCGGVAANRYLRRRLESLCRE
ncbi:MAG: tRNA (adenosine(37)-N6)-threonylcarbamoyltransferase complex transferase subunit TsaD, partial [candidate division WOR-3 bacterium]